LGLRPPVCRHRRACAKIVLRKTFSKKVFLNVPFQNDGFAGKDLKQNLRRRIGGKALWAEANFDGLKPPLAAEDQILAGADIPEVCDIKLTGT
jgi:hypothetical protein